MQKLDSLKETVLVELQKVKDPEIPVISVLELGIITKVEAHDGVVNITMTPTFTGCPAIDYMKKDIQEAVEKVEEVQSVNVKVDFSVAWSSDLISEEGLKKIEEFGLAKPAKVNGCMNLQKLEDVRCPNCKSEDTTLNTMFGPTLCRSIHLCFNCKETFEAFKPV